MKHIKYQLLLSVMLVSFGSCRDFLNIDQYTEDMYTYDSIFSTQVLLEQYLWGAANELPDEANFFGQTGTSGALFAGISASDEAFNSWDRDSHPGTKYVQGRYNADNIGGSRFDWWASMYKIIRKTNIILANIDKCQDISTVEKNEILGYTYFLRAYSYYHILMNQGPFIIVGDEILEANRESEYYNTQRNTYDECVEYICSEMERAARFMPSERVSIAQYGRPNRYAAYALVARLRLQWASPMFNGGGGAIWQQINGGNVAQQYYGTWRRSSDGALYINQTYDEERWAIAAAACKRLIDTGEFELYTVAADTTASRRTPALPANVSSAPYPNGAGGIDPFRSYSEMFTGESMPYQNSEFIWGRWSSVIKTHTQHSFSVAKGGYGGMAVPQKIIDQFYMSDGSDCEWNLEKGSTTETLGRQNDTVFSGYRLSASVNKMYANREVRFYANIGFQGRYWPMTSVTSTSDYTEAMRYADYSRNGRDGYASLSDDKLNYTMTGYVSTKYIHPSDAWRGTGATRVDKPFPIIRYAEILLSYVEALNNLTTTHEVSLAAVGGSGTLDYTISRNTEEMTTYFNRIRYRAGLPGIDAATLNDPVAMQNKIIRERLIELFHENRRFFDVRRWGIYETEDSKQIYGLDVEQSLGDAFWEFVPVNHSTARNRVTERKMIFFPLDKNELKKVPGLDQNYGW